MLASFSITMGLCLVTSVLGQENGDMCAPFVNIQEEAAYYCDSNFPPDQFKEACVLSSCRSLSGICPLTCDGNVNLTALTSAVSVLNTCIRQKGLICNYNLSHSPMAPLSWLTAQFIPPTMANGTVILIPGTGFVENLSNAKFILEPCENTNGPMVTLTIQMPNYYSEAYYNCTFEIAHASVLRSLRGLIPDLNFNTPNTKCVFRTNVTATVTIDLSSTPPTINTINQQFDLNIFFSNFVNAKNVSLDQNLINLFNTGMNAILKTSVIPSRIINFLASYAALGLQAAQQNCPKS